MKRISEYEYLRRRKEEQDKHKARQLEMKNWQIKRLKEQLNGECICPRCRIRMESKVQSIGSGKSLFTRINETICPRCGLLWNKRNNPHFRKRLKSQISRKQRE